MESGEESLKKVSSDKSVNCRGIASRLMGHVEAICASVHDSLYVDLYVKESNTNAVAYYKKREYFTVFIMPFTLCRPLHQFAMVLEFSYTDLHGAIISMTRD